jgi:hypothetical protein
MLQVLSYKNHRRHKVKKNNQWQKPDLEVVARSKNNMGTDRSGKELYGLGVPPIPPPPAAQLAESFTVKAFLQNLLHEKI